MAFPSPTTIATNNIAALDPEPSDVTGLTAAAIQATYDKFGVDWVSWFINTFLPALSSTTAGASGAHNLGSAAIAGIAGTTVYAQLVALKAAVDALAVGAIPLGSVSEAMLDFDVATQLELNAVETAYLAADITANHRMYMGV